MSRIEITDFREVFDKFAEMCYITSLNMKNGKDPSDEAWDIMEEIHRLWFDGRITLYKTVMDGKPDEVVQGGLF